MSSAHVIIILLILLIIFYLFSQREKFVIGLNLAGVYEVKLNGSISQPIANQCVKLQILPQRANNPSYLDLIMTYANGKQKSVRTNYNESPIYSYYNDYSNVLYLGNPKYLWYELHINTGVFKAITSVDGSIQLINYQITSRIS